MPAIAFTVPVVPGKEQADIQLLEECGGARREEYLRSRRRAGASREVVWHQATPQGTVSIVYVEVDDPQRFLEALGSSDDPFDRWFREKAREVHGIDLSQPLPGGLPRMVFDGPTP